MIDKTKQLKTFTNSLLELLGPYRQIRYLRKNENVENSQHQISLQIEFYVSANELNQLKEKDISYVPLNSFTPRTQGFEEISNGRANNQNIDITVENIAFSQGKKYQSPFEDIPEEREDREQEFTYNFREGL